MIAKWDKLTVEDLQELTRIAKLTCGFEITALTENTGEITSEKCHEQELHTGAA